MRSNDPLVFIDCEVSIPCHWVNPPRTQLYPDDWIEPRERYHHVGLMLCY